MKTKFIKGITLGMCMFLCIGAYAKTEDKTNEEIFNTSLIMHSKSSYYFDNGELNQMPIYENFDSIMVKEGRTMLPFRFVAERLGMEVSWSPDAPNDINVFKEDGSLKIKLVIGQKVIYVNEEEKAIDVAPELFEATTFLPLRVLAETLQKEAAWIGDGQITGEDVEGGLIVISDYKKPFDVQTDAEYVLSLMNKLKEKAQTIDQINEERIALITSINNGIIYSKGNELYKTIIKDGEPETSKLNIEGYKTSLIVTDSNIEEFYYIANVKDQDSIYKTQIEKDGTFTKEATKVCDIDIVYDFVSDVRIYNNEMYITFHTGGATMGSDILCKVIDNKLNELVNRNSIKYTVDGDTIYYVDLFMGGEKNNLYKYNMKKNKSTKIGTEELTYGSIGKIYVIDENIYCVAMPSFDQKEQAKLYKIDITTGKHTIIAEEYDVLDIIEDNKQLLLVSTKQHCEDGQCEEEGKTIYNINLENDELTELTYCNVENYRVIEDCLYYICEHNYLNIATIDGKLDFSLSTNENVIDFMVADQCYYIVGDIDGKLSSQNGLYVVDLTQQTDRLLVEGDIYQTIVKDNMIFYVTSYENEVHYIDINEIIPSESSPAKAIETYGY